MSRPSHVDWMRRCIELALQGKGRTSPNPMVGAVIVRQGRVLAEGYHRKAGTDHAEIAALKKLKKGGAKGATLYINFEPCCIYGRTPPCVPTIIESGIQKVVIGCRDPNPAVNGKGVQWLREAGVEVIENILQDDCYRLNLPFQKYITTKMPYVTLKVALTLDGKIATMEGDSQWISNSLSRQYVHELRDEVDAILVGGGTFRQDDPRLTVRHGKGRGRQQPTAVVVDETLDFPKNRRIFEETIDRKIIFATTWRSPQENRQALINQGAEVWMFDADLAGRVDLKELLCKLADQGITHLIVEGGGEVFSSFIAGGFADRLFVFIAPKLIGGQGMDWLPEIAIRKMDEALSLEDVQVRMFGDNIMIGGRLKKEQGRRALSEP